MKLTVSRLLVVTVAVLLVASAPVAAAESRLGGTVVVAEGETVRGDLEAIGGTVVVRGTVDGDVNAVGGTVVVAESGVVTGRVAGGAGAVTVEGTVRGDVELATGSFVLRESGSVGGDLELAAGDVLIDGRVAGTATVAAGTLRIGSGATIGGDLLHDVGTLVNDGRVAGDVRATDLGATGLEGVTLFAVPTWASVLYTTLVHLALGAVLLLAVPRLVGEVSDAGLTRAVESGGVGLAALVVVPVALALVAITVIGVPLALLGAVAYGLLVWAGLVLGAYVLGTWALRALDRADVEHARWLALAGGVLAVGLSRFVPGGGLFRLALTLVGAGALLLALNARRTGGRDDGPVGPDSEPGSDATV